MTGRASLPGPLSLLLTTYGALNCFDVPDLDETGPIPPLDLVEGGPLVPYFCTSDCDREMLCMALAMRTETCVGLEISSDGTS